MRGAHLEGYEPRTRRPGAAVTEESPPACRPSRALGEAGGRAVLSLQPQPLARPGGVAQSGGTFVRLGVLWGIVRAADVFARRGVSLRIALAAIVGSVAILSLSRLDAAAVPTETSAYCVFTTTPQGRDMKFLARGVGGTWSPRGSIFAVGLLRGGTRLVRPSGALIRELPHTDPKWLDETRLLVGGGNTYSIASTDGRLQTLQPPPNTQLWDVQVASVARLLVMAVSSDLREEKQRLVLFNYDGRAVAANWRVNLSSVYEVSPDARRIALANTFSVAGRSTYVLMRDGTSSWGFGIAANSFAWSPNGRRLAVVLSSTGSDMNATPAEAGLYIHDFDRRHSFRRLARRNVELVSWAPNGARIAWGTARGLFTIGAAGGPATRIGGSVDVTSWNRGSYRIVPSVIWSPDGKRIAYSASGAIFTARALGGTPVRITPADGYRHPTWSPDGSRIAFTRDRVTYRSASECPAD